MKTGSLSRRTVIATLGVLVLALGGVATLITLRYRAGLRARARSQLLAGAHAVAQARPDQIKPLLASLALEGIDAQVGQQPSTPAELKTGSPPERPLKAGTLSKGGPLLTVTEPIGIPGATDIATLST